MSLDTLLDEDQLARAEQQIGGASDAQLAQMGGRQAPQDDYVPPDWTQGAMGVQLAPDAPIPTAQDAGAPPPLPPPEPVPQTPVDLLAQVQAGQISRPAINKAFGPPLTPAPEPQQGAQGLDWTGIADRLGMARSQGHQARMGNMLLKAGTLGGGFHPVDDEASQVAGAEDELKLGQAKHAMGVQDAQEADRKAQLGRQAAGDDWRQLHERMQLTQQAQQAADRLKAEQALRQMNGEEKAVADQRAEQQLAETARHNLATEGNAGKAIDERADASKLRAKAKAGGPKAAMPKEGDIDAVPEDMRETVRAIGERRAKPPDPGTKFGQKVLGYALAVYPHLDSTDYGAYKGAKDKLAKSDELVALETARNHLTRARGNIPDNFDSPSVNRVRQAILTGTGADTLTPFETDVKIAADELAKAYGNNSETGRATIEHLLAPNQSKAQLETRLREAEELLTGKMGSLTHTVSRFNVPGGDKLFEDKGSPGEHSAPTARQYVKTVDGYGYFYDAAGKLKKEKLP